MTSMGRIPILGLLGVVSAVGVVEASGTEASRPYTRNVAIVLYPGVEVLDFAGPAEVFAVAAGFGANGQERAFHVYTVGRTREPIVSQGFLDVVPDYGIEDAPRPDVVVFPGGGADGVRRDPVWMAWVRAVGADAEAVLTVCTGAFIAGDAGFLDGQDATTWYAAVPRLAAEFPRARVHPGRRFVDNGQVITTAGVSAGIDGALHYVARELGRWVADRTAEYMEYKWSPESHHSRGYALTNPRLDARGRERQRAEMAALGGQGEDAVAIFRHLAAEMPEDADAWLGLGQTLHRLGRFPEAIPAYVEAAREGSRRALALFYLAGAYARSGEREKALEAVTGAVEAGFDSRWHLAHDEDLAGLREDPRYQALLARL